MQKLKTIKTSTTFVETLFALYLTFPGKMRKIPLFPFFIFFDHRILLTVVFQFFSGNFRLYEKIFRAKLVVFYHLQLLVNIFFDAGLIFAGNCENPIVFDKITFFSRFNPSFFFLREENLSCTKRILA